MDYFWNAVIGLTALGTFIVNIYQLMLGKKERDCFLSLLEKQDINKKKLDTIESTIETYSDDIVVGMIEKHGSIMNKIIDALGEFIHTQNKINNRTTEYIYFLYKQTKYTKLNILFILIILIVMQVSYNLK